MTRMERSQELFGMFKTALKRVEYYEGRGEPEAVKIAKDNADAYKNMYLQEFAEAMTE